jgi:hypothetical protein
MAPHVLKGTRSAIAPQEGRMRFAILTLLATSVFAQNLPPTSTYRYDGGTFIDEFTITKQENGYSVDGESRTPDGKHICNILGTYYPRTGRIAAACRFFDWKKNYDYNGRYDAETGKFWVSRNQHWVYADRIDNPKTAVAQDTEQKPSKPADGSEGRTSPPSAANASATPATGRSKRCEEGAFQQFQKMLGHWSTVYNYPSQEKRGDYEVSGTCEAPMVAAKCTDRQGKVVSETTYSGKMTPYPQTWSGLPWLMDLAVQSYSGIEKPSDPTGHCRMARMRHTGAFEDEMVCAAPGDCQAGGDYVSKPK